MNNWCGVGRLTRDPDISYTTGENANCVARFTVAVNRRFKNAEGNYDADFVSCVAFGKTAEMLEKYFKKGMAIGVTGEIRTGSYTNKDGVKVYTTDVNVNTVEFVESKNSASSPAAGRPEPSAAGDGFMSIPDGVEDEGLPF